MYYLRSQLEHYQIDVIHHKSFQNMFTRGDHFQFGSVFIKKKSNQTEFFFQKKPKPNRNRFKPTNFSSVWFFRTKTGLARFFSRLGSVQFFRF